jgi:rhomboid protease GluP
VVVIKYAMNIENQGSQVFIKVSGKRLAEEYALLLTSLSIPASVIHYEHSWSIGVATENYPVVIQEIEKYEKDGRIERHKSRFDHIKFQNINKFQFFGVFFVLALFHFFRVYYPELNIVRLGRSSASAINEGEWFRAVTALTLHSGIKHLFSNIFFGGIVVFSLSTLVGTGKAWFLGLLSGFLGNMMNAWYYGSAHNSIGASTAVFGVVGILGGLQFFSSFRERKMFAWLPFAAALAMLAFLGSSLRTDVLAHFFGFVAGVPIGLVSGKIYSARKIEGAFVQNILFFSFIMTVVSCWMVAFGFF